MNCPICGSTNVGLGYQSFSVTLRKRRRCKDCGTVWKAEWTIPQAATGACLSAVFALVGAVHTVKEPSLGGVVLCAVVLALLGYWVMVFCGKSGRLVLIEQPVGRSRETPRKALDPGSQHSDFDRAKAHEFAGIVALTEGPVFCPNCQRKVRRNEKLAWRLVACPHCHTHFQMPGKIGWMDRQLLSMHGCVLALLLLFLTLPSVVVGMVGLVVCKHPLARRRSEMLAELGGILVGLAIAALGLMLIRGS